MTTAQFERLIEVLERLVTTSERGAAVQEAVLPMWYAREQRDLYDVALRNGSDRIRAEQMRASLAVWDAEHIGEGRR